MANPILDKIKLSGVTYDIQDNSALHTLDSTVTSGGTNAVKGSGIYNAITAATGALAETIENQHYQTSGDVQNAISGKADSTAVTQDIAAAVSGKADTTAVTTVNNALTAHTANTDIHVTTTDKSNWNAKLDASAISGYADSVKYDSTGKTMTFYHGGTGGTAVYSFDASPFLIDGMVQNVEVKNVAGSGTCLVITFNTDAGKQDINIPISQIFDANNYYTKQETSDLIDEKIVEAGGVTSGVVQSMIDNSISGKADTSAVTADIAAAVSGKADTSAVAAVNDALTAHTANTDVHVTTSDKATWSGKQDALVSGTNIKTINGTSILGSGDITVQTLPTVSGTTLIFS